MNMQYEQLIDPTDSATLARYLANPDSGIHYLLHVPSRSHLVELAEKLDGLDARRNPSSEDPAVGLLHGLTKAGSLLISSRDTLAPPFSDYAIPVARLPRTATCFVIFSPPFYLVHTPGLFEELRARLEPAKPRVSQPPPSRRARIKF